MDEGDIMVQVLLIGGCKHNQLINLKDTDTQLCIEVARSIRPISEYNPCNPIVLEQHIEYYRKFGPLNIFVCDSVSKEQAIDIVNELIALGWKNGQ